MKKVSIIVPTYNEVENIKPLITEIFGEIDKNKIDLEIIFVDDNSPDGTGKEAEKYAVNFPIQVLHRSGKLGLGSAVIEGFKKSNRDIIGVMDADLSHDPTILNSLIGHLDTHDIAIGSRFEIDSSVDQWNWRRKIISYSGVTLAKLLTGVKDPLSGYFFLDRQIINDINLTTKGYKILLEILVKANYKKLKEVPFTFRVRKHSVSKLNYKEYILFIKQIITYFFIKLSKKIK